LDRRHDVVSDNLPTCPEQQPSKAVWSWSLVLWHLPDGLRHLLLGEGSIECGEVAARELKIRPREVTVSRWGIFHDPLEVVLQNLLLILVCKGPTVPLPQPLDKVFAASYIRPEVEEPSVGITLTNVCDPGALLLPSLLNDQPT
jgi:hypothetical protein